MGLINKHYSGKPPPHGSLWILLFPSVMIEWYPHILVISTIKPINHEKCINYLEYYAPKDLYFSSNIQYEKQILPEARRAYQLSAIEDMEICQTMQDSYRNMWNSGEHFVGPHHPYLEQGISHFFSYINKEWRTKYHSIIQDIKNTDTKTL
jgi:choline monooxygenase